MEAYSSELTAKEAVTEQRLMRLEYEKRKATPELGDGRQP